MKKTFWNKRIPSLLGLLFLAISVGVVSWFGKSYTELQGKASVGEMPINVQISNITDTSFTVSYTTKESVVSIISYGPDLKLGDVALDSRDQEARGPSPRKVHYVTISDLNPDTKYYFTVRSGATEFLNSNQPYEVTTATSLPGEAPNKTSVRGSVNFPDGTIPIDGIVYLSTSISQLLSVPLKSDGTYLLPVSYLRTSDLKSYVTLENEAVLQITVLNAEVQSHLSVNVAHSDPVPLVTLSKDYDFTIDTSFANFIASNSADASPSGTITPGAPSSGFPLFQDAAESGPSILTPENGEQFIDPQPLFEGTASPYAAVFIIIESTQEIRTSVKADSLGNWEFRPTTPLEPGEHAITITTLDTSGIQRTIKRSFTVFAEGSQFTEPSVSPIYSPTPTASASPTPTPSKSAPTAVPTPTSSPTSVPTSTVTPTQALTPVPTLAPSIVPTPVILPTATPIATPTPTPLPISPPGSSLLLISGALAMLSIAAGFMIFFLL